MKFVALGILALMLTACASGRLPAPRGVVQPKMHFGYSEEFHEASEAQQALSDADRLFGQRKYDEAREAYENAAEVARRHGNNSLLTETYAQVARMHGIQGKFGEGRPWLAHAKKIATPFEPRGWSRYLGVRGRFEWQDEKDNEKAKQTFIEMYEYCKQHELFSRELDAAHMVAIVGTPDEQVEWALKAISAAEKGDQKGWLGPLWNNLGWTYEERGEYEKMLDALTNARKYHYEVGSEHSQLVADFGVGTAQWRNGNLKEARSWLEDAFTRAKQRYDEDPADANRAEWVGWGHSKLGDLLVSEEEPAEALAQYKAARPYLVQAGIENWWPEGLKKLDDKISKLEKADGE